MGLSQWLVPLEDEGSLDTEIHTQGECHVTTEAENGVMRLQTKKRQGLSTTTRSWERHDRFSCRTFRKEPTLTIPWLDFWYPELWESKFLLWKATNFVVFCYGGPRKFIQAGSGQAGQVLWREAPNTWLEGRKGLYPKEGRGAPLPGEGGKESWAGKYSSPYISIYWHHLGPDFLQVKTKEYGFALWKIFIPSSKTCRFLHPKSGIYKPLQFE